MSHVARLLRKRANATVEAVIATEPGVCMTERGPMEYATGDWLLTTTIEPVQTWPVSQEYLDANYEDVPGGDPESVEERLGVILDGIPASDRVRSVLRTEIEKVIAWAHMHGL